MAASQFILLSNIQITGPSSVVYKRCPGIVVYKKRSVSQNALVDRVYQCHQPTQVRDNDYNTLR